MNVRTSPDADGLKPAAVQLSEARQSVGPERAALSVCAFSPRAQPGATVASAEHRAKAIQQKLDRLDDAFIYKESIDLSTYERQRDRLREELTLVEIDRHGAKVEEFDVEGILNFAERVPPRAFGSWIQASLEQRQRLQRLFFSEGVAVQRKGIRSKHRNVVSLRVLTAACGVE